LYYSRKIKYKKTNKKVEKQEEMTKDVVTEEHATGLSGSG
jgi:hypothetical protein